MTPNSKMNQTKASSMMAQELRAIEKIKEKQKKEVEQMIDYEMRLTQIKQRNEEKAKVAL